MCKPRVRRITRFLIIASLLAATAWAQAPAGSPGASRSTVWHWVFKPETQTGMVRVTWTKDSTLTATVGSLKLGRDEGFDCNDD
jgi:hypothetical protein